MCLPPGKRPQCDSSTATSAAAWADSCVRWAETSARSAADLCGQLRLRCPQYEDATRRRHRGTGSHERLGGKLRRSGTQPRGVSNPPGHSRRPADGLRRYLRLDRAACRRSLGARRHRRRPADDAPAFRSGAVASDPVQELADAYFDGIPDVFAGPTRALRVVGPRTAGTGRAGNHLPPIRCGATSGTPNCTA